MTPPAPKEKLVVFMDELPGAQVASELGFKELLWLDNVGARLVQRSFAGAIQPELLASSSVSADGLVYRLTIHKGIQFHCQAELTAHDVIAALTRVTGLKDSAAQLADCIQPEGMKRLSRYRVELRLVRPVPDFLELLSLPELTITHQTCGAHCGAWRPADCQPGKIILTAHNHLQGSTAGAYGQVELRQQADDEELDHNIIDHPFVQIYSGIKQKTPAATLLNNQDLQVLPSTWRSFIFLSPHCPNRAAIKGLLSSLLPEAVPKSRYWRRDVTNGVFPKGHRLHVPFTASQKLEPGFVEKVRIAYRRGALPGALLANLSELALHKGCELIFEPVEPHVLAEVPRQSAWDGMIAEFAFGHPLDAHTPAQQISKMEARFRKVWLAALKGQNQQKLLAFCRDFHRLDTVIPFISYEVLVRANRPLADNKSCGTFKFTDVGLSLDQQKRDQLTDATLKSIGMAVQMFAHDVKQPFSQIQSLLALIADSDHPERVRALTRKYVPEIKKTAHLVNHLLQDIIEIGANSEIVPEQVSIKELLAPILQSVFELAGPTDVVFHYHFGHQHLLDVDVHKVARVLTNLLVNANHAMGSQGDISFYTQEQDGQMVLTIRNTNSYIPEEKIVGLFDRFYTEGKKQGTGLGLAIVKKFVEEHAGRVWCESSPQQGTAFYLTLPVCIRMDASTVRLPRSAKAMTQDGSFDSTPWRRQMDTGDLRVLLVDDEPVYLDFLMDLVKKVETGAGAPTTVATASPEGVFELVKRRTFDLLIIDVELGVNMDGLQTVRHLRRQGFLGYICVHSGGSSFDLARRAVKEGADIFLPKPMHAVHLHKLFADLGQRQLPSKGDGSQLDQTPLNLVIVDDDALVHESWAAEECLSCHNFFGPEDLLDHLKTHPHFLHLVDCVVIDYTFPGQMNGLQLAERLTKIAGGADTPIFLATDRPMLGEEAGSVVARTLTKETSTALAAMRRYLMKSSRVDRRTPGPV